MSESEAFYLPGVVPHSFSKGENVELKVNKLRSEQILFAFLSKSNPAFYVSSVHTLLPYDYYSLKFCKPSEGVKTYSENLGEFLRGDRIENSAYDVSPSPCVPCYTSHTYIHTCTYLHE